MIPYILKYIIKRFDQDRTYHVNKSQFAKNIGIHRQTLVNLAKGNIRNPSIIILVAIADYFKISLDELIGRTCPSKSSPPKPLFLSQGAEFKKELFVTTIDIIFKYIEKNKLNISFDKIVNALDGIYENAIKQDKNTPDPKFAKWLLDTLFTTF